MLLPLAFLTGTGLLWSAIGFGLIFGFLLHRGGVTDFNVIVRLFQFRDFTVLKVMMSAIAVGGVGVALLHGQDLAQYHIKPTNLLAVGLGAAIFGVGMVLLGYCPGTGLAAAATGRLDALAGLAGMMVGGIAYALTFDWVAANILPVGAYGGRADIMEMIAPAGPVYQAGTLSGNPLATTAGLAMLGLIQSNPEVYQRLEAKGKNLANAITQQIETLQIKASVNQIGSMFTLFFTEKRVENFKDAKTSDLDKFGQYFRGMLKRGIYLPPSQFESWFLSDAIGDLELEKIITASWDTLSSMQNS